MEFMPGRVCGLSAKMLFVEGMIQVVSPLILMYITKYTEIFLWIPFIINILAAICFIVFYIPESIKWTLDKGHFDQAKKDIDYINKINKANNEARTIIKELF